MKYIKNLLAELQELRPIETDILPIYRPDKNIKAVLFDIYGTLLISSSGDIDETGFTAENLNESFVLGGISINPHFDKTLILNNILNIHKSHINKFHEENRSAENPYPEIDILQICKEVLAIALYNNWIICEDTLDYRKVVFAFETFSNQVFPMPEMKNCISWLEKREITLGIISNAQFYTPVILNYFLNNQISDNETVTPFEESLSIFSYKLKRSKPDIYLFELMLSKLHAEYNIEPQQVMFVGNDMLKDIYPAHKIGFKTALFAGDKRSLRLHPDNKLVKNIKPDFIINNLGQILEIIT